ncbi:MAG TPA: cyclic nucleotide-binding domain-containing protein [Aggregatilineales bacterium]|nr:cyclic nucleotide-binding domain-containing protein [Anaerolineales bacterium]HRE47020.1 cyclic nucleotide-binding domain-containing protein [Aggregatilineales bacterium]
MRKVLYILGQLNDEDVEWLAEVGRRVDLDPGAVLIKEGSRLTELHIVLSGVLAISAQGRALATLGAGEMLGEVSFVDSRPTSATVTVVNKSRVLSIPIPDLHSKLGSDPEFSSRFYRALAVFLAYRLRDSTVMLGYSSGQGPIDRTKDASDELDDNVMDTLWLAGSRFERLLKRLDSAG